MSPSLHFRRALLRLALAGSVPFGCLPEDTRPAPGVATVVVTSDVAGAGSFITNDGWTIVYAELLVALGNVSLEGDACNQYGESDYLRVLDLLQPNPQRLNVLHGLGLCELAFSVMSPSRDAVLGPGTTEATRAFLRTGGSDPFSRDRGIALYVAGNATRQAASFGFAWAFRLQLDYRGCGPVRLVTEQSQRLEIVIEGAKLFGEEPRFDAFAAADGNGDSELDLEELAVTPDVSDPRFHSLGERLYLGLAPSVPRLRGDTPCSVRPAEDD